MAKFPWKSLAGTARRWMLIALKYGVRVVLPIWLRRALYPFLAFRVRQRLTPSAKPRILFVGDCYYNFWFLSRELRKLEWVADTLRTSRSESDRIFLHDADVTFGYRSVLDKLRHWAFFLTAIWRYDIFHFYGVRNIRLFHKDFDWAPSHVLPESWEVRLLKSLGKRVLYTAVNCVDGVLQSSMLGLSGEVPCGSCRWRDVSEVCADAAIAAWSESRNRLTDGIVGFGLWHKDYNAIARLHEVPEAFCLAPEFWHPGLMVPTNYKLPVSEDKLILYHSVGNFDLRSDLASKQNLKSTHVYLDVVERLKEEGHPVELVFFKDVPNRQIRFYQAQADIVVDMLTFGWYGANVREAMMLGKPVVCYIRPEWLEEVDRQNPGFAEDLPVVSATPETVFDVLVDLIEHPEKRAEIGRRSREFAVKWHSAEAGARRMSELYLEVLGVPSRPGRHTGSRRCRNAESEEPQRAGVPLAEAQPRDQLASMAFWNNWCQSYNSEEIVLNEITPSSLESYDRAYLSYYPYLLQRVRPAEMAGKRVLEIGLGFGTLGQKIAEAGADYLGMDVASNQVDLMNYRLDLISSSGRAVRANFLKNKLADDSFDFVVSIGCFHHTGDMPACVRETYRVLKPGGVALVMIYNRFSFRQWTRWPVSTFRALFGAGQDAASEQRAVYDSCDGEPAPITEFTSVRQAKRLFAGFSDVVVQKENCDDLVVLGRTIVKRRSLLRSLGRTLGLDIYIEARK
jgi:SAM-dependent methyltransferase/glycosyltransferase involved in cell wall biosynthesis